MDILRKKFDKLFFDEILKHQKNNKVLSNLFECWIIRAFISN